MALQLLTLRPRLALLTNSQVHLLHGGWTGCRDNAFSWLSVHSVFFHSLWTEAEGSEKWNSPVPTGYSENEFTECLPRSNYHQIREAEIFFPQKVKVLILLLTFSEEHWRKLPVCCAPWFVGIQSRRTPLMGNNSVSVQGRSGCGFHSKSLQSSQLTWLHGISGRKRNEFSLHTHWIPSFSRHRILFYHAGIASLWLKSF